MIARVLASALVGAWSIAGYASGIGALARLVRERRASANVMELRGWQHRGLKPFGDLGPGVERDDSQLWWLGLQDANRERRPPRASMRKA